MNKLGITYIRKASILGKSIIVVYYDGAPSASSHVQGCPSKDKGEIVSQPCQGSLRWTRGCSS